MKIKNIIYLFLTILLFSCNKGIKEPHEKIEFSVKLIVDYGGVKENLEKDITSHRQLTALEALQYASIVITHSVGEYVFVNSIDSVQNIRGIKAWYYTVNRKMPKVLAINNRLNSGDTICWIYKEDVCSHTVEK